MAEMSGRRTAILGSCVSRDALELEDASGYEVVNYVARCHTAAFGAPPVVDEEMLARVASPFQRRMLRHDMAKTGLDEIASLNFDWLVIDLIDDRLDIQRLENGHLRTVSSEYRAVAGEIPPAEIIRAGTPEHMALWKAGWLRLRNALRDHGISNKTLVNRVFWADNLSGAQGQNPTKYVQNANLRLVEMYAYIRETTAEIGWITYPEDIFSAAPDHRWGPAPFHYSKEVYST
ncbi:hypothetical protein GCM10007291_42160 [Gemmobacter nanjingensis]|uniref:Uncharacterized protein n=1 Tax=Gemmobacter nanjingensis TaxID=488454 RepID=A0ABQ3FRT0_9RHOB|nr:DUF6270 domain-containing protein [Gemmobacter nanjingensis]GHC36272.1 hypothetical protein GCM10007291_42160 [Gemmobacter nanjingensis]